jgi:hypothetical protein
MEVYVITNLNLGWDCIEGVFSGVESLKSFLSDSYPEIKNLNSINEIDEFLVNEDSPLILFKKNIQ